MTETKKILNRGYILDKLITAKLTELDEIKLMRNNISSPILLERINGGAKSNKTEDLAVKIIMYEQSIDNDIDKLITLKESISSFINTLEDEDLIAIMSLKYVSFKTYEEIADILTYSLRQVYRIHKKALLLLCECGKNVVSF